MNWFLTKAPRWLSYPVVLVVLCAGLYFAWWLGVSLLRALIH